MILINFDAKINFMIESFRRNLNFKMHVLFFNIFIVFQIDHFFKLINVYSHVKICLNAFIIYYHFFVINRFEYFIVFDQIFCFVIFINYDYRSNNIYAICFNSKLTQSTIVKIINRYDKINKNRKKMYEYIIYLKC